MKSPLSPSHDLRCSLHDWASLRSELLFAFDQAIPAGLADSKGTRVHDEEFSAWLVRSGWARIKSNGEEREARAGQWLICLGKEIEQKLSPDAHLLSMRVLQGWPDGTSLFSGGTVHVLEAAKYPRLEKLALSLIKLVGKVSVTEAGLGNDPRHTFLWRTRLDYVSYVNYERRLLAWLAELAQSFTAEGKAMHMPDKIDPRLAKAFHLLDSLSPGSTFPERELCRIAGLSIGRLNRLYVQAYGFTTFAYWEQRRVARARQVMELPSIRIKEVASELGFVQLSHFSAWFKRHCGKSPRDYRQSLRPTAIL